MSDPQTYKAYLNTTQGVLAGRPDDADLVQAKAALDNARIAYLYAPDTGCPRAMFFMRDRIIVGAAAIQFRLDAMASGAS